MAKRLKVNMECAKKLGIDLRHCKFLGQGSYGQVFLLPDGNVIKIFKDEESCIKEYMILQSVEGSKHFPHAFQCFGNCMIREYVGGMPLIDYLKKYKMSRRLAANLIYLIEDFKFLGFTRLDIRCSHIFVNEDESVMVIDPRNHYTDVAAYPKKMLAKLKKIHSIGIFMDVLKEEFPYIYDHWKKVM